MTLERLTELIRRQAVWVASASRHAREREMERYELLDAMRDEMVWAEKMRQQCIRWEDDAASIGA
jgi:hypothetical protein